MTKRGWGMVSKPLRGNVVGLLSLALIWLVAGSVSLAGPLGVDGPMHHGEVPLDEDRVAPRLISAAPSAGGWIRELDGLRTLRLKFSERLASPLPAQSVRVFIGGGPALFTPVVTPTPTGDELVLTLPYAVTADLVTVVLDYAITDLSGNALDGELNTPQGATLPSGDGRPGGQAVLRFNVLEGDVNKDGVVDANDLGLILDAYDTADPQADLNGNGVVDGDDIGAVINNFGGTLAFDLGPSPTVVSITPSPADPLVQSLTQVRLTLSAPITLALTSARALYLVNDAGTGGTVLIPATSVSLSPDAKTATFTLAAPATPCAVYRIGISPALASLNGALLVPAPSAAATLSGFTPPPDPLINATPLVTSTEFFQFAGDAPLAAKVQIISPAGAIETPVVNGKFTGTIQLPPDMLSTVYFTSISPCGVKSSPASRRITRDATAPDVFIDSPAAGDKLTTSSVSVVGRVGDAISGASGITVKVNGQNAQVSVGSGNNGTFVASNIPLNPSGTTTLTVVATDSVGNAKTATLNVSKYIPTSQDFVMEMVSGDGQGGIVKSILANPLVVRLKKPDGSALAGKLVTFDITRGDGQLLATINGTPGPSGPLKLQVFTDSSGVARAYWKLGSSAGPANNRVSVISQDLVGAIYFAASATPAPAERILVGDHNYQKGQAGAQLPQPLIAFVTDGDTGNGIANVPVVFTVTQSDGYFTNGLDTITVPSDASGHAQAIYYLGITPGVNTIQADFAGNGGLPATFTATGLLRDDSKPTTLTGVVEDNAGGLIGGALVTLKATLQFSSGPALFTLGPKATDANGRFTFTRADLPSNALDTDLPAGPAKLLADARNPVTLNGNPLPVWSFPYVGYELTLVKGAENSLPTPIYLPRMDPRNEVLYDGTKDVVLTMAGVEGLKFTVKANSLTRENGTRPSPSDPEILRLNQVHFDKVPMPLPDGTAFPLAWTLQPKNAEFNPPIAVTLPNIGGLAPGSSTTIVQWNNDTANFQVMATAKVSADGSTINSDPGTGITVAGWGGATPPPPPTTDVTNFDPLEADIIESLARSRDQHLDAAEKSFADFVKGILGRDGEEPLDPAKIAEYLAGAKASLAYTKVACAAGGAPACAAGVAAFATYVYLTADELRVADLATALYHLQIAQNAITQIEQTEQAFADKRAILGTSQAIAEAIAQLKMKISNAAANTQHTLDYYTSTSGILRVMNCLAGGGCPLRTTNPAELFEQLDAQMALLQQVADQAMASKPAFDAAIAEISTSPGSAYDNAKKKLHHRSLSVRMGGRTATVEPSGTFTIRGLDRPTQDRRQKVMVVGEEAYNGLFSQSLSVLTTPTTTQAQAAGFAELSSQPPPAVRELTVSAPASVVLPGASLQLNVAGRMSDGSTQDLTYALSGSLYQSTSNTIAAIDENGLLRPREVGTVFVIVTNEGATAVKRIDIASATFNTNITGIFLLPDGTPAVGASITALPYGGAATTDAAGGFSLSVTVPSGSNSVRVSATLAIAGKTYTATSASVAIGLSSISDAGVIKLNTHYDGPLFPGPTYEAGLSSWFAAMGDLDGDGMSDLAVTNAGSNTVSVLRNLGNGAFAARVDYATGEQPVSVAIADLEGDGRPDLAVANSGSNTVSFLKNLGNGAFASKVDYTSGSTPLSVSIGDLDGDGKPDLAIANRNSNAVSVLRNLGNGAFAARVDYAAGSSPASVAIGDLDGNGRPELVVTNQHASNTVGVYKNLGNGTFAARVSYPTGVNPKCVTIGDLDGDGSSDLAVANWSSNTVSFLKNLGNGAFASKVDYAAGSGPASVAIGDLDDDGRPELVVGGFPLAVLRNLGNGAFAASVTYAAGVGGVDTVAIGDLDGDNRRDLAVAVEQGASVLRNLGTGEFAARVDYVTGNSPYSVAIGDLDDDGRFDVVVANQDSNTVSVLRNLGNGAFGTRVDYTTGSTPLSVSIGDLDGDGKPDLAIANRNSNAVSVLRNLGNGAFASRVDYATGNNPNSVAIGDFDGDGRLDVAVANQNSHTVSVLRNLGNGAFAQRVDYVTGNYPYSVAIADLDGDGKPDLAVANESHTVSVMRNSGEGAFAPRVDYATGSTPVSVAIGDLDGDGKPDLAIANRNSNTVSVLRNHGNGAFAARVNYVTGNKPTSVVIGDFDGDGRLDVAVANQNSHTVSVLTNLGNGAFAARVDYATLRDPSSVAIGDFDSDGKPDLAVASYSNNRVSLLRNQSGGQAGRPGLLIVSGASSPTDAFLWTHRFASDVSGPERENSNLHPAISRPLYTGGPRSEGGGNEVKTEVSERPTDGMTVTASSPVAAVGFLHGPGGTAVAARREAQLGAMPVMLTKRVETTVQDRSGRSKSRSSVALGIDSDTDAVVGWRETYAGWREPFLWTQGTGMRPLSDFVHPADRGLLPTGSSEAVSFDAQGRVCVRISRPGVECAPVAAVRVRLTPDARADQNGDGLVTFADVLLFQAELDDPACRACDINLDGVVDEDDLLEVAARLAD